ncbi:hypothetical protein PCASD_15341 [Puccinia coronata f. sp. avenae]|uniref:Uncharacterized protein n=1 Tax=Puccinia coronata f. sp. avenae TaxID=200324 RepID=A0A2N5UBA2_9BASI|nr:hypothetical protein PCASD_15341 [Puccinia coronata f. sp. avenae]
MASQVWVTVNGQDYMLEEVSRNGLTEGFTTNSPVHISVLLILTAMVRANINACYVWNLPGAKSSGPSSYPFNQPPYCLDPFVDSLCILRRCNRECQNVGGSYIAEGLPPELATARVANQVAFLAHTI